MGETALRASGHQQEQGLPQVIYESTLIPSTHPVFKLLTHPHPEALGHQGQVKGPGEAGTFAQSCWLRQFCFLPLLLSQEAQRLQPHDTGALAHLGTSFTLRAVTGAVAVALPPLPSLLPRGPRTVPSKKTRDARLQFMPTVVLPIRGHDDRVFMVSGGTDLGPELEHFHRTPPLTGSAEPLGCHCPLGCPNAHLFFGSEVGLVCLGLLLFKKS